MGHRPTLSEIEQRQQRAWASGDDAVVAGRTALIAALADVALRRSRLEATAVAIPSDHLEVVATRSGYGST
jgi:hypothetical protein